MNTKNILVIAFLLISTLSLSAQKTKQTSIDISKSRSIVAKLLVELDKTPKVNSNNNGRENSGKCCMDGITAPSNYQVLALGLSTNWYLRQEGMEIVGVPNPIPYLGSLSLDWEVSLYTGDADFIAVKSAYIQDNELLISIDGLPKGKYFIEIEQNGDYYCTGFSIGTTNTPPISTGESQKN